MIQVVMFHFSAPPSPLFIESFPLISVAMFGLFDFHGFFHPRPVRPMNMNTHTKTNHYFSLRSGSGFISRWNKRATRMRKKQQHIPETNRFRAVFSSSTPNVSCNHHPMLYRFCFF